MRGGDRLPCELCRERDEDDRKNSLPTWARPSKLKPMTLLVEFQSGDDILFWGDGKGTFATRSDDANPDTLSPTENVHKVMPWDAMPSVMWGFAGSNRVGLDLANEIANIKERFTTWTEAKCGLEKMAGAVLQSRRQAVKDVGGDPSHAGLDTWYIFAGKIGPETRSLRIDAEGLGQWVPDSLCAEGKGSNQFRIFWNAYRELHPEVRVDSPAVFLKFVDTFSAHCDGLYPPGNLWVFKNDTWTEHDA